MDTRMHLISLVILISRKTFLFLINNWVAIYNRKQPIFKATKGLKHHDLQSSKSVNMAYVIRLMVRNIVSFRIQNRRILPSMELVPKLTVSQHSLTITIIWIKSY